MALNTSALEKNIADKVSAIDCVDTSNVSAEIAKIIATEVANYLAPFVSAYNSHTHTGVITAVSGGGGAPAIGVPGASATTTKTI